MENTNFCRCCLNENLSLLDMQTEYLFHKNQEISIYDAFFECLDVPLETFLQIPIAETKICQNCLTRLENVYEFRELCRETTLALKEKYLVPKLEEFPLPTALNIKCEMDDDADDDDGVAIGMLENENFLEFEMKEEPPFFAEDTNELEETESWPNDDESDVTQSLNTNDDSNTTFSMKRLKKKYTCSVCAKSYRNQKSAEKHFEMHTKKRPAGSNDPMPTSRKNARIIEEPSNVQYRCEICLKVCKQYSSLYDHLKRVHNSTGFTCDICVKYFKTHTGLQLHNKAHHLNLKFPCDLCPKVFNRKCNLLGHHRMEHLGVRQECKLCQKQFRTTQDLWIHSFEHRGFYP
jgi:hypothetical protein